MEMMLRLWNADRLRVLTLSLVAMLATWWPSQAALGCDGRGHCWPTCPRWCSPAPPTELVTGNDPNDLKIEVVGPYFGTIEVYFRNEFYRETFANTAWLQYDHYIALAPKNSWGTFAVLHDGGSSVKAYGWKKDKTAPEFREIPVMTGHPVMMQWVTDRILKVRYGPCLEKETIVRFNDSDTPWTQLFAN
jgi:hypothetical protein